MERTAGPPPAEAAGMAGMAGNRGAGGAGAPGAAGGAGIPPVLRAKLRPPPPPRAPAPRHALQARLRDAVAAADVVLVQGPGGIGKTSLLAGWAAAQTRPVAWLTVDARDDDPSRFWSHVAAALAGATGDPAPSPADAPAGSELFVDALAAWVARSGARPIMVLDEYEQLTADGTHAQLDAFIRACGDALTTVVAARARPPLRLDRPALAARLAVLDWTDLRMDENEAGPLLRDGFGLDPSADEVAALVQATDGWAAGLALAGARLRAGDRGVLRTALRGGPPPAGDPLADHLLDHVWAALPAALREFLLDTSVLDRLCAPLAAAVHPPGDAAGLIDRLRRDGTFLHREADGHWFRYQRAFRWALAARLAALDPDRERAAHRAAARWHAAHGDQDDAADHALRAGDHAFAVELIERSFDALAAAGRLAVLERRLASLPDEVLTAAGDGLADRVLDLWCALGRRDERDRWSRATGRRPAPAGPARPADVWQLCAPRESGDLARAVRHGRAAVARTAARTAAVPVAGGPGGGAGPAVGARGGGAVPAPEARGAGTVSAVEPRGAETVPASGARGAGTVPAPGAPGTALAAGWASPLTATQARVATARGLLLAGSGDECTAVLEPVEALWGGGEPPAELRVAVHAIRGLAAYRRNDPEEARRQAVLAERAHAASHAPPRPPAVPEFVVLGAALTTMEPGPGGAPAGGAAGASGGGWAPIDGGDAAGAPDAVGRLRELVAGLGPDRSMAVFGLLVLARAYLRGGDTTAAARLVGAADAELARFPSALGLIDFRDEVAAGSGVAPAPPGTGLLTEREQAVLRYLRSDLPLKEIAAHLYVSVNTVKTHARHVYRKLGVTGRRELAPHASRTSAEPGPRGARVQGRADP